MSSDKNLISHQSNVVKGLGSFTHTCTTKNMYVCEVRCHIHPGSQVTITFSQSGSTTASVTSKPVVAGQQVINLRTIFNCAVGDVITKTLTSSASIDNQLNTVLSFTKINAGTI